MATPEPKPVTKSLYARINEVKKAITRVKKSGKNRHFGYDYATESDISDMIRPLMADAGVCLVFKGPVREHCEILQEETKSGNPSMFYRIWVKYLLVNTDNPAEQEEVLIPGEAIDQQDKGFSKAMTAAAKYAWLKIFDISTGEPADDRDADQPADKEERKAPPRSANPRTLVPTTPAAEIGKKIGPDDAAGLIHWLTDNGKSLADLRAALAKRGLTNAIRGKEENVADWPASLLAPITQITNDWFPKVPA